MMFVLKNSLVTIDKKIPNFIDKNLDSLTEKMSDFYNEIKFPNYDDLEDYASLYDKGENNLFTKRLDEEIDMAKIFLSLDAAQDNYHFSLKFCQKDLCS